MPLDGMIGKLSVGPIIRGMAIGGGKFAKRFAFAEHVPHNNVTGSRRFVEPVKTVVPSAERFLRPLSVSMGDKILLAKLFSGLLGAIAMCVLAMRPEPFRISNRIFSYVALGCLLVSRLAIFVAIFLVLGVEPQSDTVDIHRWTVGHLQGLKLYDAVKGIPSCYAPLYLYITSAAEWVWRSPLALILQSIVFELIAFPVWMGIGRRLFDERHVRLAAIVYVCSSIALWSVAVTGQNQSWVALFLSLAVLLLIRGRDGMSGATIGLSVSCIKFLPLLYVPALLLNAVRPVRWAVGCVLVPAAIYGLFAVAGFDVLFPVRKLSGEYSSGNLPFLASLLGFDFTSESFRRVTSLVGVGLMGLLAAAIFIKLRGLRPKPRHALALVVLLQMVLMLVSNKSHTSYLVMCLFPVSLVIAQSELRLRGLALLGVFQVVGTIEQSFWYRAMQMHDLSMVWHRPLPEGVTYPVLVAGIGFQFVVLAFYVWCARRAWAMAFETSPAAALVSPARA